MAKRKNQVDDEVLVEVIDGTGSGAAATGSLIEDNQKTIIGVLFAIALAIGLYYAYKTLVKMPADREAGEMMYQAQRQFEQDSFTLALTNPGGGFPGFEDIIDQYGSSPAGNTARYYAGISYLNLGQFDKAVESLKSFSPVGDILPIVKYGAIGDAYAELNDMDNALSFYKKAVAQGDNSVLTPIYLKKLGLWFEKNDNKAEALAQYQAIKTKFPKSLEGSDIDKYLSRVQ